jgi:hypothetical protein
VETSGATVLPVLPLPLHGTFESHTFSNNLKERTMTPSLNKYRASTTSVCFVRLGDFVRISQGNSCRSCSDCNCRPCHSHCGAMVRSRPMCGYMSRCAQGRSRGPCRGRTDCWVLIVPAPCHLKDSPTQQTPPRGCHLPATGLTEVTSSDAHRIDSLSFPMQRVGSLCTALQTL